jgi:ribosomal protein L11 methyltransferase
MSSCHFPAPAAGPDGESVRPSCDGGQPLPSLRAVKTTAVCAIPVLVAPSEDPNETQGNLFEMPEPERIPYRRAGDHAGWIETTLQFLDAQEDTVGAFVAECLDLGATGSVQDAGTHEAAEEGGVCEGCGTSTLVRIYFPESLGLPEVVDLLESRIRALGGTPVSPDACARVLRCRRIEPEEWATSWKGSFPPERVSRRFWVVPPWERVALPEDAVPIILRPGLAFGTGKHPSTRHCLELLEDISDLQESFPGSCLDVGCGSAILSIAALRLGADRVVGLDIDPDAVAVARGNLELNRLAGRIRLVNGPLECCRGGFELITANLDATTLLNYDELLWSLLMEGGFTALAGIVEGKATLVLSTYVRRGFQPLGEKKDREEGWTSFLLRKP